MIDKMVQNKYIISMVDARYNDTVGIRERYRYIQTIDISSYIESI